MPSGLSSGDLTRLQTAADRAWGDFLELARACRLSEPSRLPGWDGHAVCAHLGSWPESGGVAGLVRSARLGASESSQDPDAANDAVVRAHASASRQEVLDALQRAREDVVGWLGSDEARELAELPAMSWVGPVPLASLVHAAAYELAVHGLDLAPCGAPRPSDELLDSGLAALTDVTGALAARYGIHATVSALGPRGGWQFTTTPGGGWTTAPVIRRTHGPAVSGDPADILDATAGRAQLVALVLNRRLVLHDLPGFLRLAPIVEAVPGIPGGAGLRGAARALSGAGSLLGRVGGLLGRRPG